jgi:acetyltransferase-like isoleucine patch superfamily enzyme
VATRKEAFAKLGSLIVSAGWFRRARLFGGRQWRRWTGQPWQPVWLRDAYPQHDIGEGSYGGLTVVDFHDGGRFRMGRYCSTANGSRILLGGGHRTERVTTYPFSALEKDFSHIAGHPVTRGAVTIGSDVWIATDALVQSGVAIGDGAVVMARAVVTRDVLPYAIVGGVPARQIGTRFDDATIVRLLALAWWNWDRERILRAVPYLLSDDVSQFLDLAESGRL